LNQLNVCINNRTCINKMSFVRKNTPIEDCGSFLDTMKKAKDAANKGMKKAGDAANKGMKKAGETWRNTKKTIKDELKTLSIDDALNTFNISEKDAKQDLMENGKQFVPPNKL